MKICVVANERHLGSDPEYDPPETLEAVANTIRDLNHTVWRLEADSNLYQALQSNPPDLVFNLAEGHTQAGRSRESLVPAICEMLRIPYTGPDLLTAAATLDKQVAKMLVLAVGVPVAPGGEYPGVNLNTLQYPVVVKPLQEGSSKGVTARSLCSNPTEALEHCNSLQGLYGRVLVEHYLPGREITVAIQGNTGHLQTLGMLEVKPVKHTHGEPWLYGKEEKGNSAELVRYCHHKFVPAELDSLARKAYTALGCRDWARIDFRLDAEGNPVFIEANPLPGLDPQEGDFVMAAGIPYQDLIQQCLGQALQRIFPGSR